MSSSSQIVDTWISNFCNLVGHEYFAEVAEDFIEDDFNLTGLSSQVPLYKEALEMILDVEPDDDDEEEEEEEEEDDDDDMIGDDIGFRRNTLADRRHMRMSSDTSMIEHSAELLYGLIHQRYITSRPGIQQMLEKYELQHFGHCPRVLCHSAKVIPVGRTDTPGQDTVKLFCPSCLDIFTPPNSRFQQIDGAFFGTTFGYLFFMTFPDLDIGVVAPSTERTLALPPAAINSTAAGNGETYSAAENSISGSVTAINSTSPSRISQSTLVVPLHLNGFPTASFAPGLGSGTGGQIYEPRVYGFRVSERSRVGPRMQWLRMKPENITELDEVAQYRIQEDEQLQQHAAADVMNEGIETPLDDEAQEESNVGDDQDMPDAGIPNTDINTRRKTRSSMRGRGGGSASSPIDANGVGDDR
jgi:casein kinase II subunit beta